MEEEFIKSEVMAKGEEVVHTQTETPVKQGPMDAQLPALGHEQMVPLVKDLQPSATPSSETLKHPSTVDTVEIIEQVSYPESYQPLPEENHHVDHEEPHVPPTSDYETGTNNCVAHLFSQTTTDGTTLVTAEISEHHLSAKESLDTSGSSATEDDQPFSSSSTVPQEGDLPVVQEDNTTEFVPSEHTTVSELVHSSTSQHFAVQATEAGDSGGTEEDTFVLTASTPSEEPDVHSTTVAPPVGHSLHKEDSGDERDNHDAEGSTTERMDGEEESSSSEKLVPTAADPDTAGK